MSTKVCPICKTPHSNKDSELCHYCMATSDCVGMAPKSALHGYQYKRR